MKSYIFTVWGIGFRDVSLWGSSLALKRSRKRRLGVFGTGLKNWKYWHTRPNCKVSIRAGLAAALQGAGAELSRILGRCITSDSGPMLNGRDVWYCRVWTLWPLTYADVLMEPKACMHDEASVC